jgi:hypothetical protein
VTGLTEYARSRPRREGAGQRATQLGSTSESLELVPPVEFLGPVGSGVAGAQPYAVEVDLQVGGGCGPVGSRVPLGVNRWLCEGGGGQGPCR